MCLKYFTNIFDWINNDILYLFEDKNDKDNDIILEEVIIENKKVMIDEKEINYNNDWDIL